MGRSGIPILEYRIMTMGIITRQLVAVKQRNCITAELFGVQFSPQLEPFVFAICDI